MTDIPKTPRFHLIELFELDDLDPNNVDAIEIHPCATYTDNGGVNFTEQCGPDEAQFYSVFFHLKTGGLCCIADCADSGTAAHVAKCLARLLNIEA